MGIPYGISEDIGFREAMEDERALYDDEELSFFSAEIYDGHGGRRPAQAAAEMLTPAFLHALKMEMKKLEPDRRRETDLLREAYLEVDAYIAKKRAQAGTCAVQLYIRGDRFMAANTGDSRAIIGTEEGVVVLTRDHKPDDEPELSRIEALGGTVVNFDVPRVEGILAISRALGDTCLKPYVTPEPRIIEGTLGSENDRSVLACDGVWDVLSPEEVIEAARLYDDPEAAAKYISKMAREAGSRDNITVIVLDLRHYTAGLPRKKMKITGIYDRAVENT
jgi:serine/threonine protein phosphatase PrpC